MNKKQLVILIKKMAQNTPARDVDLEGPDPAVQSKIQNKPVSPNVNTTSKAVVTSGNDGIKEMQQALVNLSQQFTSQRTDLTPGENKRKSFADYISGGLKDPNSGASAALEQMKKLNDPKIGGFPLDGKWGPKTYDALSAATQFGSALFNVADQFKMQSKTYTKDNLNELIKAIGSKNLTQDQKVQIAPGFTQHINAISKFYTELMNAIMASPANKEMIEGAPEQKVDTLAPKTLEALNNRYKSFVINFQTDAGMIRKSITVNDFSNMANLQAWKDQNLKGVQIDLAGIISQLKQQINELR